MQAFRNYFTGKGQEVGNSFESITNNMETTPETAEIVLVIDRSGSMQNGREDFEGGINAYIDDQKAQEGKARITIVQFDNHIDVVYHGDIKDCPRYTLSPRGGTALNDCMGQTINFVGELLRQTPEENRPKLISIVTTTDGGENGSSEFDTKTVQDMIQHQTEKYNWVFVFLGADYDAVSNAGYASTAGTAANFSKGNSGNFYKGVSAKMSNMRGLVSQGVDTSEVVGTMAFTEEEREDFNTPD